MDDTVRALVSLLLLALCLGPFAGADPASVQTFQESGACHDERSSSQTTSQGEDGSWTTNSTVDDSSGCESHETLAEAQSADGAADAGAATDSWNESALKGESTTTSHPDEAGTVTSNQTYDYDKTNANQTRTATWLHLMGTSLALSRTCGHQDDQTDTGGFNGTGSNGTNWTQQTTHKRTNTTRDGCDVTATTNAGGQPTSVSWFDGCYGKKDLDLQYDSYNDFQNNASTFGVKGASNETSSCNDFVDTTTPAGTAHADDADTCTTSTWSDIQMVNGGRGHGPSQVTRTCQLGPTLRYQDLQVSAAEYSTDTTTCPDAGNEPCTLDTERGVIYQVVWPGSPAGPVDEEGVLP